MRLSSSLPAEVRTPRLLLRRQGFEDASLVKEAVDSSLDHLKASVPWARYAPFPLDALAARLVDSAADFDAGKEWTFSIFDSSAARVMGAVALEPGERELSSLLGGDVIEMGYWLRVNATGQGYATEAVSALVELAFRHLGVGHVAICHDPRNMASAGVPRRLGFRDFGVVADEVLPGRLAADGSVRPTTQVWVLDAPDRGEGIMPVPFNGY